ncbi:hypothetical protein LguiB_026808 [Lonicera macranthoides]
MVQLGGPREAPYPAHLGGPLGDSALGLHTLALGAYIAIAVHSRVNLRCMMCLLCGIGNCLEWFGLVVEEAPVKDAPVMDLTGVCWGQQETVGANNFRRNYSTQRGDRVPSTSLHNSIPPNLTSFSSKQGSCFSTSVHSCKLRASPSAHAFLRSKDLLSLYSSIWKDCSYLENIDFNTIKVEITPKPNYAFQYTEHVIEEEPVDLEPISQKLYFDLNTDYEPLIEGESINKGEAKNAREANNDGEVNNEGEPLNPSCGSQHLQLTLSTNHDNPSNDEISKARAVDVTSVFTTDEVSTHYLS